MPRVPARILLAFLLALVCAGPAHAQRSSEYYEARYGTPQDVSLTDLVQGGTMYDGRAVRTRGRLEMSFARSEAGRVYQFRDFGAVVTVTPLGEVGQVFEQEAQGWLGRTVKITGVYNTQASSAADNVGVIQFLEFEGPRPEVDPKTKAPRVTLESLLTNPGRRDGQLVRVVGQFRGQNLFGDLPAKSMKDRKDWVIKDDAFAAWVHGRDPEGDGWKFDAGLKRDTGRWLEVLGRVSSRGGVVYIDAADAFITTAPRTQATVAPAPTPPPKPLEPPVIVFTLPLEGEAVAPSATFSLQFSKDMNEESFQGRVQVRYAGPVRPGDRSFDGVKLSEPAEPIPFRKDERVRVVLINDTMMPHPIHLHGHFFELVTGHGDHGPRKHTVNVPPGGKVTFDVTADAPGDWAFHCHNLYHMTAGMMRVVTIRPFDGENADAGA